MLREGTTIVAGRRVRACFVICPEYTGKFWDPLPRLADGVTALTGLLDEQGIDVVRLPVESAGEAITALKETGQGGDGLLVYVGGHGIRHAENHYTALDTSPLRPDSLVAISTRQLGEILSGQQRDVVVVLDTCYAAVGSGVVEQALKAMATDGKKSAFALIAACGPFEPIDDGVFVEAILRLLREGPQVDLTAWTPEDATIRLGTFVEELQSYGLPVADVTLYSASELRLPNPRYRPQETVGRVEARLQLRQLSADGDAHLYGKSDSFVGRTGVRQRIVEWVGSATNGMLVVTGGPGTGKSALMGILARQSVGDPEARRPACAPLLGEGTFDAIVHAHQKTVEEVTLELAGVVSAGRGTVLVDALDEAVAGHSVGIAAHLRSLAQCPQTRVVVGTRPSPATGRSPGGTDPLLGELGPAVCIDLDDADEATPDIERVLHSLLTEPAASPYAGLQVDDLVAEVAALATPSFLVAQAAGRWLLGRRKPIILEPAWRERVARFIADRSVGALVEADLRSRFSGPDFERACDLMRALAWAEGLGLPRYAVWPELAEVLSPGGRRYGDADVTWLLYNAGWYLTEAGEDGQTVYRLFHRAVIDWFRAEATSLPEAEVQVRVVERLRAMTAREGGWLRANPYVLHYLVVHAARTLAADDGDLTGSPVGELLDDASFVTRAEPVRLSGAVVRFRGRIAGCTARLVERCVHEFTSLTPEERVSLLDLVAAQEVMPAPTPPADLQKAWSTTWAAWQPSAAHVVLAGHEGGVNGAVFSPDGATVASASDDGTVRLWDARTGEQLRTLVGHGGWVNGLAFSPDGALLGSAGEEGTVRIWDAHTGDLVHCLSEHGPGANYVAFARDGETFVSGGDDGSVRLWNVATGERLSLSTGHIGGVTCVGYSPDGASTASAGHDGTVRLWDAYTGLGLRSLVGHDGWVTSVAFSPDGRIIASAGEDGTVRRWDRRTGAPLPTLESHKGWVSGVTFSPDGCTLASAGDDGKVRLWNHRTGEPIAALAGHDDWVWTVEFSPDGDTMASASYDGTVRLWDARDHGDHAELGHQDWVNAVAVSPDGATIASAGHDRSIRLWDAVTARARKLEGHGGAVRAVAFSAARPLLASGGDDGTVRLWDADSGDQVRTFVGHDDWVNGVAFSPDGSMLASASDDGTARVWDVGTGALRLVVEGHDEGHVDWVSAVAFSPDGGLLACACEDGTARLWTVATGYPLPAFVGHDGGLNDIGFSPDGSTVATAGEDGTLRLWDLGGRELRTLSGHDGGIHGVAFSTDGTTIASAGFDRSVRVWDVASGRIVRTIPFRSTITGVARRGSVLAVGAAAGVAVVSLSP